MAYEQIQNSLMREQEKRRALQKRMMSQPAYNPNQQVSGRSVPYSPIQGLTTLGKAWLQKKQMDESDRRTDALKAQQADERTNAYGQMVDMYKGREEVMDQADMTTPAREGAVPQDKIGAAMFAAQDPYLKGTGISQKIMPSKDRGSYSSPVYLKNGELASFDSRNGGKLTYAGTDEVVPRQLAIGAKHSPANAFNMKAASVAGEQAGQMGQPPGISGIPQNVPTKGDVAASVDLAKNEANKIIESPRAESNISGSESKTGMLTGLIDKAKGQADGWSTGILNATTGWIPGTPSFKLNATLETIKSNIGFDKLAEMRDNPTGGALGQVSEFENKLLQAVWGNLNASNTEEEFKENLDLVQDQVDKSWSRIKKKYKAMYGVSYESTGGALNPPTKPAEESSVFEGDKESRYQEWKEKQLGNK